MLLHHKAEAAVREPSIVSTESFLLLDLFIFRVFTIKYKPWKFTIQYTFSNLPIPFMGLYKGQFTQESPIFNCKNL